MDKYSKSILDDIKREYNNSKGIKKKYKNNEYNVFQKVMFGGKNDTNSDILRNLIQKEVIRMKYGDPKKGKRNLKRLIKLAYKRYDNKGSLLSKIFNQSHYDLSTVADKLGRSDITALPFHHLVNLVTGSMPITRNIKDLINDTELGPELDKNVNITTDLKKLRKA